MYTKYLKTKQYREDTYKDELNPELGSLTANLRAIERYDREEKIKKKIKAMCIPSFIEICSVFVWSSNKYRHTDIKAAKHKTQNTKNTFINMAKTIENAQLTKLIYY